jgi:hypothetical protein
MAASVEQVATACNIDVRRVQQLAKEGVFPRESRGEYSLGKCMAAYIRYLQAAMSSKSSMDDDGNVTNTKHQRSRLLDVELATAEINLARAREQVMAIDDHKMIIANLILETKARVMTIGARAAPKVLNQKSRGAIKKAIDVEALDTLVAMSKVALPMPAAAIASKRPAGEKVRKRTKAKKKVKAKKTAKQKPESSSSSPAS